MSSTYLFHIVGLISLVAVAITDCSRCSINKFETIGDTGLPIAVRGFSQSSDEVSSGSQKILRGKKYI